MLSVCVSFQRRSGDSVYHESVQQDSAESSAAFRDCGQTGAGLSQLCPGETHTHTHSTTLNTNIFHPCCTNTVVSLNRTRLYYYVAGLKERPVGCACMWDVLVLMPGSPLWRLKWPQSWIKSWTRRRRDGWSRCTSRSIRSLWPRPSYRYTPPPPVTVVTADQTPLSSSEQCFLCV